MDEEKDFNLEEIIAFMKAAHKACRDKKADKVYPFICPICGGEALAEKAGCNGHHQGQCEQCDMNMIE